MATKKPKQKHLEVLRGPVTGGHGETLAWLCDDYPRVSFFDLDGKLMAVGTSRQLRTVRAFVSGWICGRIDGICQDRS